jgi:hypothetical protein
MQPAKAVAAEAASPAAVEMGNGAAAPGLQRPDAMGRFGRFGGKYVPETLMHALTELESAFHALATDDEFQVALPLPLPLLCGYVPCLRLIVDSVLAGIWMPSFFFGDRCLLFVGTRCHILWARLLIPFLCSLP